MPSPIGQIVIKFLADTKELGSGLSKASSLIRDWSLVATGLTQGITNAFRLIATVGIKAVTVSLAGLTAAFLITAKSGADFEDNMVRTFAILQESAGATQQDLAALTEEARRLGRDTLASGTQAAEGMMILARAGFDVSEIMTATQSVIDLSIVGNMSVAESATAAASAMRGFGLEASDLARVNDVLAKASSLANTDIRLLSSALSFVAPLSRAAGISIEETATAIDILSNAGIRGSRAGTTLRRMLSVLLAPTGRAKRAFDEMNLSFVNSEGKINSLSSVLRKLESAGLTAAETMEIFGLRAGPGVAALLGEGSAAFDKLKGQIEDSEGAADRMSQAFRTSVKGRVLDLTASIKDLGLAFSEEFKKPLADSIFAIRNWIVDIVEANQNTGFFKAAVEGMGEVLSPVIERIKEMARVFSKFLSELTPETIIKFFAMLSAKIENFIQVLEENKNKIIDFFMAAIRPAKLLIKMTGELVKAFLGLPEPLQEALITITAVGTGLLILAGGIVPLISLIVVLGLLFGPTRTAMAAFIRVLFFGTPIVAAFTAATGAFSLAIKGLAASFISFGIALLPIIGVIGILGFAFLAAFAAGSFLIDIIATLGGAKFGENFKKNFEDLGKGFKDILAVLPDLFKGTISEMESTVKDSNMFGSLPEQLAKAMREANDILGNNTANDTADAVTAKVVKEHTLLSGETLSQQLEAMKARSAEALKLPELNIKKDFGSVSTPEQIRAIGTITAINSGKTERDRNRSAMFPGVTDLSPAELLKKGIAITRGSSIPEGLASLQDTAGLGAMEGSNEQELTKEEKELNKQAIEKQRQSDERIIKLLQSNIDDKRIILNNLNLKDEDIAAIEAQDKILAGLIEALNTSSPAAPLQQR